MKWIREVLAKNNAMRLGYIAAEKGQTSQKNPYNKDDSLHYWWEVGYTSYYDEILKDSKTK